MIGLRKPPASRVLQEAFERTLWLEAEKPYLIHSIPATFLVLSLGERGYVVKDGGTGKIVFHETDPNHAERALQWAVNNLPSQGGTVRLSGGLFVVSASVEFAKEGSILEGEGFSARDGKGTVIKLASGVNAPVLYVGPSDGTVRGICVRNLVLDGNKAEQTVTEGTKGLWVRRVLEALIENVVVMNCKEDGVFLQGFSYSHITLRNVVSAWNDGIGFSVQRVYRYYLYDCFSIENGKDGFSITGYTKEERGALYSPFSYRDGEVGIKIGGAIYGVDLYNPRVYESGNVGIHTPLDEKREGGIRIFGGVIERVKENGIDLAGKACGTEIYGVTVRYSNPNGEGLEGHGLVLADNSKVFGGTFEFNWRVGIMLCRTQRCLVDGATCRNNGQSGSYDVGIQLRDDGGTPPSMYNRIVNCRCYDNQNTKTQNYGIAEMHSSDHNIFENNDLEGNGKEALHLIGPNSKARNNKGYLTDSFKSAGLSVEVGTGDTYGAATEIKSPSGVISHAKLKITIGGTFATDETVTVKVECVWESGNTTSIEKAYTATGSEWLSEDDWLSLWRDSDSLRKINVYAKSNQSSTSVTCSVDVRGSG